MNWPLRWGKATDRPEKFWRSLYADLPTGADHARFCAAVEEAIAIYQREDTGADEIWKAISERLRPQAIEKLFVAIGKLGKKPPPAFVFDLPKLRHFAAFQEQFERKRAQQRRERYYGNLLTACTKAGGLPLSDSDSGPLVRVFRALVPELSRRGVRELVRRHKRRLERRAAE
jgi:hypothetical protein